MVTERYGTWALGNTGALDQFLAFLGQINIMQKRTRYWWDLILGRLVPAMLFAVLVVVKLETVSQAIYEMRTGSHDWANLLIQILGLFYFTAIVGIYVFRLPKKGGKVSPIKVIISFFGSFGLLLTQVAPWFLPFLPIPPFSSTQAEVGILVAIIGLAYSIWSLAYLRRSFSILPESRQLVTGGPYKLSRHPLYLGEAVTGVAVVFASLTWWSWGLVALYLLCQWIRMGWEEKILTAEFPEYKDYSQKTPRYLPNPFVYPSIRKRLGARGLMLGGVLVMSWMTIVSLIGDPDFWWHLRTGRWIWENFRLPSTDLYTFTVSNHIWTDHEWLSEVLLYLVWRAGGDWAFIALIGLITFLGFILIWKRAEIGRRPAVIAGLGLALALIAGAPIWGPRIQMLTFFFTCLELYWLHTYLKNGSRWIYGFPIVIWVWVNLHGSFIFGLGLISIVLACEAIRWALGKQEARKTTITLFWVTVASSLIGLINPHTWQLYLYALQTQTSPAQQSLIVEWFSPNFHLMEMRAFEIMIFLFIVGLSFHKPRLHDLVLALVALALALQSVRHIVLFIAVATPVLIECWSEIWEKYRHKLPWQPSNISPSPIMAALTAVLLIGLSLFALGYIQKQLAGQNANDQSQYPVAAASWLAQHPEVGTKMFNQYGWGGYLAWRFYPDPNRRVFIFGEAALMGDHQLQDYNSVASLSPDWEKILDKDHVDYVLYNKGSPLDIVLGLSPDWQLVYSDKVAVIYARKAPNAMMMTSQSPT